MEDKILNATIRLWVHEGVRKMTMDEIAKRIGVSKATIYKYFVDKDTLYFEAGSRVLTKYSDKVVKIATSKDALIDRLYNCVDVLCGFTNSGELALCKEIAGMNLRTEAEYERYLQIYKQTVLALIDEGMENGLLKKDLNSEDMFCYIDMSIAYYQQNAAYREKMQQDKEFQHRFLLFFIGNIFKDSAGILAVSRGDANKQTALQRYIGLAKAGTKESVDEIMEHLNMDMTIAESKFIDFALSHVNTDEGIKAMEHYLFLGTQVQRNYCTLYFARRGEYLIVRQAYDEGLIDAKQAFSR